MNDGRLACSVIVPAYQERDCIVACLSALSDQSVARARYEIIVVDDASTDGTPEIARQQGADVVLTISHGGAAAARNAGLRVAQADIVLFTDADCRPGPSWIETMLDAFNDTDVVGVKGTYRTEQRSLISRLVQLEFEIRYQRMQTLPRIDFIDTYSAAYRRHVLEEEGGFDTAYPFPANEDVDLSFRLAKKGYCLVFVPEAWVHHLHSETLISYLRRKGRVGYWRGLLYSRYPGKMVGDSHTYPWLKYQFPLVVMALGFLAVAVFRPWLAWGALATLVIYLITTLPFVVWAWPCDRVAAIAWPFVNFARVLAQGTALVIGLLANLLSDAR